MDWPGAKGLGLTASRRILLVSRLYTD